MFLSVNEFQYADVVLIDQLFNNDEMASDWYNGKASVSDLSIYTQRCVAIHANAFSSPAFEKLENLSIEIHGVAVNVFAGAFEGLRNLITFIFQISKSVTLPIGLFDPIASSINVIKSNRWPNDVSLNEMFANQLFRLLRKLTIYNAEEPQSKFRLLAASNFTSFRRLQVLLLSNCGIEIIDEHAFDDVGRTLQTISLFMNRIKFINIQMFRIIFESHRQLSLDIFRGMILDCSCHVLEVRLALSRFQNLEKSPIKCSLQDKNSMNSCSRYQVVNASKLCINRVRQPYPSFMNIYLKRSENSIVIQSNLTSKFRVLLINLDATNAKCAARNITSNYQCSNIDSSFEHFDLDEVENIRNATIILITAIPVLIEFGAWPLHMIPVRRVKLADTWQNWIHDNQWLLITCMLIILCGSAVGFGCGTCWPLVKHRLDIFVTNKRNRSGKGVPFDTNKLCEINAKPDGSGEQLEMEYFEY